MPKAQVAVQKYRWVFTLKKDEHTSEDIIKCLKQHCKQWCFQEEKGDGGYEHYQGRLSLKEKKRLSEIRALFPGWGTCHWEAERDGDKSGFYVTKEESRVAGPWSNKDVVPYIPRFHRNLVFTRVQQWIFDKLKAQDDRKFLFLVDKEGGTGKSTFGTQLSLKHGGIRIPASIKTAEDALAVVYSRVSVNPGKTWIIYLDIPRSVAKAEHWGKWLSLLEDVKNGHAYDKRYTWKECFFEPPKVLVVSNSYPPKGLLTGDRYDCQDMLWIRFTVGDLSKAAYEEKLAARKQAQLDKEKEQEKKKVKDKVESVFDLDDEEEIDEDSE